MHTNISFRQRFIAAALTLALALACGFAPAASAASPGFYTVFLELQGGSGTATQIYAYKGTWTGYRISSFPVPSMEGYTFEGWYDADVGGEEVDDEYEFEGDTTIYAHWVPISGAFSSDSASATTTTTSTGAATAESEKSGFSIRDHLGTIIVALSLGLVTFTVASAG